MRRALAGLRRYQEAERPAPPEPMPVLAETHGAKLRDYGGEGPPVLFVPSLINPPTVLDLGEGKSLLRWLAGRGHRVLLLDWGWPSGERLGMDVAGHVERILLPMLHELSDPPHLVGYCLGGTMAIAAAQHAPVRSLATIAAPWHFAGYGDQRDALLRLWEQYRPAAEQLGVLPMEALQSAFWSLDPDRTVAKFEAFAEMEGEAARSFVALEDWANDGPPLPAAAARELFEDFVGANRPGSGSWSVAGESIDPARLSAPLLDIVSTSDRIVPAQSACAAGERIEVAAGHVGMVVGSRAREVLWQPLHDWIGRAEAAR